MMRDEINKIKQSKVVDDLRNYIDSVQICAKYQKVITDDVLTLSKLEFDQVKLMPRVVDLVELVDMVVKMFMAQITKKQLQIKVNTPKQGVYFMADHNRISQVMINLLSNAVKFTNHGHIELHLNWNQSSSDKYLVECMVSDTGTGMSQQEQGQLFNRFEQVAQRANSEYGGSGL
ncbi:hypothetical protein AKO1_010529, partial [Acrasis kona]